MMSYCITKRLNAGSTKRSIESDAIYGVVCNSIAFLADAGHNLSDALGMVVTWAATVISMRPPTRRVTYRLKVSSIDTKSIGRNSCIAGLAIV